MVGLSTVGFQVFQRWWLGELNRIQSSAAQFAESGLSPEVRVDFESCMSRVEFESECVGLESESNKIGTRV